MQCWTGASGRKGHREMHTTLGLQNRLRGFHKHFQPSDDCTVIKKACPNSCPCHASSVRQSSRLVGQLKQQTDLDKKQSYKNTNNFQMGVFSDWSNCAATQLQALARDTQGWGDGVIPPLLVPAQSSASQADKETSCALRALQSLRHLESLCSHFWSVLLHVETWLFESFFQVEELFGGYLRRCSLRLPEVQHQCLLLQLYRLWLVSADKVWATQR